MDTQQHDHDARNEQPDYIRILSHQLKSPINSIQSLLNTISEGFTGDVPPKTQHFIDKATDRANEAKELISDLLSYEALSQTHEDFKDEVDIAALVQTLVNKYASRAAEQDIFLHVEVPFLEQIFVAGDSRGLAQALRNILENAIKYTPAHGNVTVALTAAESGRHCHIQIADTGYGIPETERAHIFKPFYRANKHKATIAGTGLGLPIAQRVIVNHKGTITVDSVENQGTTFTITLPYLRITHNEQEESLRKRVVIIGGVTAGPKVAARLRRLDESLDIAIIEKEKFLSYTGGGLPWYISGQVESFKTLMTTADNSYRDVDFFESIENIAVLNNTLAVEVGRDNHTVVTQNLKTNTIQAIPYDTLILATGAEFAAPPIPGIDQPGVYNLYGLQDAEALKEEFRHKLALDVAIIGGGLIGATTAEALTHSGVRVMIFEKQKAVLLSLTDLDIGHKIQHELEKKGIKVISGATITRIERARERLRIITEDDAYAADLIILATGVKPNTLLARTAGLEIGPSGGVVVSPTLQTSDDDIYAVGDCAESINLITQKHEYWPLGSISTKMGRIAADNICGRHAEFEGSIGTVMLKMLDVNIARTGLTLKSAKQNGFDAESVVIAGLDRAPYNDEARNVILKVIADRKTHRLLGAQGYGKGDIVPKIQMLAGAIAQALTLEEVFRLDLGYSPHFNMPIDLVQTACLVLTNKIEGIIRTISLGKFLRGRERPAGIVDVSPFSEHSLYSIPGSINIPLENLRREDIPFEKDAYVVLYSHTSSGAYKAYRYLISKGYTNLKVLEGGYVYWKK